MKEIPLSEGEELRIRFPDGSIATVACHKGHLQIVNYNGYLYNWNDERALLERWSEGR